MTNNNYIVKKYLNGDKEEWDAFVLKKSINGNFLHTRNFLSYHPNNRFIDASVMIYHKNKLVAVVPACMIENEYGVEFYSHKGATYGGIVVSRDYYKTERLIHIVDVFDEYISHYYKKVTLKITSDIHSRVDSDLLQFVLRHSGYSDYVELNTYIDLERIKNDVMEEFDRNKIRNIKKCEEIGLIFREIHKKNEIIQFYNLLEINLSKFDLKPIHSIDEILLLKEKIIPENVKFYGVFNGKEMMAGGMMFVFDNVNVIHAQNLSYDYRFDAYSPISYLYYRIIEQARNDGYRYLSWGISTENNGKTINYGLIRNKESYGSCYQLNRTYYKFF